MELPNDDLEKNNTYTQNELWKNNSSNDAIKNCFGKKFYNTNLLLNNEIKSNSGKNKDIIGKVKVIQLKTKIGFSANLSIPMKKEKSSNLSTFLCKNIYLIFYRL